MLEGTINCYILLTLYIKIYERNISNWAGPGMYNVSKVNISKTYLYPQTLSKPDFVNYCISCFETLLPFQHVAKSVMRCLSIIILITLNICILLYISYHVNSCLSVGLI